MRYRESAQMLVDVKVPMPDGVALSTDVYLPAAGGPSPVVLIRTPYGNNTEPLIARAQFLADHGYACVIQDCRGRWDSEGSYAPFHGEAEDGQVTHQWIGQQPWSNGKIGTTGGSYLGMTQWLAAPQGSEHLLCMVPRVTPCNFWESFLVNGVLQFGVLITWGSRTHGRTAQAIDHYNWSEIFGTLPLRDVPQAAGRQLPFWGEWLEHFSHDDYWQSISNDDKWEHIQAPALNMGGWFDLYSKATFDNFNGLRQHGGSAAARQSKLIVGPWPHRLSTDTKTGDVDFGLQSLVDLDAEELRWFDYWLKGVDNGIASEPPLRIFIMGSNVWRNEQEWPLARTDWQRWYLHSGGGATTLRGDGALSPEDPGDEDADHYVYDPAFPAPTTGGPNCCSPHIVPWGPYDQRAVEMRADVLCYTSAPLEADLEITGPITVVLYATTDGPDTDWTAKLVDVAPNGYAMSLCDGIVRARYRNGRGAPVLITPGEVYQYEIDLAVTANVFRAGHHLRVEISSSNFPRFDRNLNTGHDLGTATELRPAHQTVHHSRSYPSHVVLPVIPTD